MNIEELKQVIGQVVENKIAPMQETQRKYADQLAAQAQHPAAQDPGAPADTYEAKGEKLEPGIRLARSAKLMILSKNDPEKALRFAAGNGTNSSKGMYPDDKELHQTLKALSTTTPSDGGFLIPEQYAAEIIPLLYPKAVVRKLGARSLPLTNGNLNMPKMLGGASSYYLGENMDAKSSQPNFGNVRLSAKKLVTLVPISNDLIRSTSPESDRMVRDDMIRSMALKEDWAAMYGTGTEYVPRGIYNVDGITTQNFSALPDSDSMAAEFVGKLMTKNIDWNSVGWIFNGFVWNLLYNLKTTTGVYLHRDELNKGLFLGYPYAISNQIKVDNTANAKTDIFFGDFSEFIIGQDMNLEIFASNEATYNDGTGLVSAFSQDQTVIKMTSKHDFGVRHPEAFVVGQKVYTK